MKKYKLDLHVHSILSYDAGIVADDIRNALATGRLDYIAITDHNHVEFAQELQQEFKEKIIVGEEIMTKDGEVIGLFLQRKIPDGLTLKAAIAEIKHQNGLVYIPHPFMKNKHGICKYNISENIADIDIIEVFNGRSLTGWSARNKEQQMLLEEWNKAPALGSDAHSSLGMGNSYLEIETIPNRNNLVQILRTAQFRTKLPKIREILAPVFNKLKKKLK